MGVVANRRQKDLPSVANKVVGLDEDAPLSATNLPVAIVERKDSTYSSNMGTNRALQNGWAIVGNADCYIFVDGSESLFNSIKNTNGDFTIEFYATAVSSIISSVVCANGWDINCFRVSITSPSSSIPNKLIIGFFDNGGNQYRFESPSIFTNPSKFYKCKIGNDNQTIRMWIDDIEVTVTKANGDRLTFGTGNSSGFTIGKGFSGLTFSNSIFGVHVNDGIDDETWQLDETTDDYVMSNSGNWNRGIVTNYYAGLWEKQDEYSWQDEEGYTLSDGVLYFRNDDATGLIDSGVYIPKLQGSLNKCVAYLANGERADLEFIGRAPSRVEFVNTPAIVGDGSMSFNITGILTTDTFVVPTGSDTPTCTTNGVLDVAIGDVIFDFIVMRVGVPWARFVVTYVENPANYILFNVLEVSSAKNGSMVNGTTGIRHKATRPDGDLLQLGIYYNGTQDVPILFDLSVFADGAALSSGVIQDDCLIDTGTETLAVKTPRTTQAERINRFWTDANDDAIPKTFTDFTGVIADQDFSDISGDSKVKNMRKHHDELDGRQLDTETHITNN